MFRWQRVLRVVLASSPVVATLLLQSTASIAGQNCVDYKEYLHTLGAIDYGNGRDVDVRDGFAFIANIHGPVAMDVRDPRNPETVSVVTGLANCTHLALYEDYAYVAYDAGIEIFNISDPYNLTSVGTLNFSARRVTVDGSLLYVAGSNLSMRIFDLQIPTSPVVLGTYGAGGGAYEITIDGSLAYIARATAGMEIVDVSDPANPTFVSSVATTPDPVWVVATLDDYAYLAAGASGLLVYDVSNPTSPVLTGSAETFDLFDIDIIGNSIVVAGDSPVGRGGVEIYDVSNPANPVRTAVSALGSDGTRNVLVDDDFIYTSGREFTILDASSVSSPEPVYEVPPTQRTWDVTYDNGLLLAAGHDDLTIYDIADPTTPVALGSFPAPDYFTEVVVFGSVAYVADASFGLYLVDVSDPTTPTLMSFVNLNPGVGAERFVVTGGYAYVRDRFSGFHVLDVSDPGAAAYVASLGDADAVATQGGYLYVTDDEDFRILDISTTPDTPALVGELSLPQSARDMLVQDDLAFLLSGSHVYVIDISFPDQPVLIGQSTLLPRYIRALMLADDVLYVSGYRMTAIDVSVPQFPTIIGGIDGPYEDGFLGTAAMVGDLIYYGGREEIWAVPVQCDVPSSAPQTPLPAERPFSIQTYPNPMTDSIQLSVESETPAKVQIFGPGGRLVFSTDVGTVLDNGGVWSWNGLDSQGRSVKSGVYYLRWSPLNSSGSAAIGARFVVVR